MEERSFGDPRDRRTGRIIRGVERPSKLPREISLARLELLRKVRKVPYLTDVAVHMFTEDRTRPTRVGFSFRETDNKGFFSDYMFGLFGGKLSSGWRCEFKELTNGEPRYSLRGGRHSVTLVASKIPYNLSQGPRQILLDWTKFISKAIDNYVECLEKSKRG